MPGFTWLFVEVCCRSEKRAIIFHTHCEEIYPDHKADVALKSLLTDIKNECRYVSTIQI